MVLEIDTIKLLKVTYVIIFMTS